MSTCTAANIQAYCKRRPIATPSRAPSMPTPSPAAASNPVKSEVVVPASSSPPAPSPAAASKPVKSEVVVPASSSPPAPSPAAASKPVKSEVDSVQEPEPTTPKAKKHKSSHVLRDDEQEAVHAKQPPPKRRKLTEAQKRQAWRQEGLQLCQQKGVDYRNVFQQTRANLKAAIPQNHWPEFLIDLGRNVGHMKCHACRALRLRMLSEQSPPGQTVCPALGTSRKLPQLLHSSSWSQPCGTSQMMVLPWLRSWHRSRRSAWAEAVHPKAPCVPLCSHGWTERGRGCTDRSMPVYSGVTCAKRRLSSIDWANPAKGMSWSMRRRSDTKPVSARKAQHPANPARVPESRSVHLSRPSTTCRRHASSGFRVASFDARSRRAASSPSTCVCSPTRMTSCS